jgi:HK97 family phage major capsid protein
MLDDQSFDVEAWLASEVAMEFADQENAKFLTGNGILCPKGILAYTLVTTADATRAFGELQYVKTAEAAAFKAASATVSPADCLIDLQQALKPGYRNNATWLMNSTTVGIVRKFKNAVQGDLIWQPALTLGAPSLLLGKPVEEDENMPAIGANNFPVLYGDFKRGYTICDRIGTRVLRDPFTNKPYVMFYTTKRVGGYLENSQAIKAIKCEA